MVGPAKSPATAVGALSTRGRLLGPFLRPPGTRPPLISPLNLRTIATLKSRFRGQEYKRLEIAKAPAAVRLLAPNVRAAHPKKPKPSQLYYAVRQGSAANVYPTFKAAKRATKGLPRKLAEIKTFAEETKAFEYVLATDTHLERMTNRETAILIRSRKFRMERLRQEIQDNGGIFAVRKGLVPGIYLTWSEVLRETGTAYQSEWRKFATLEEAKDWMGPYKVSPNDVCYEPTIKELKQKLQAARAREAQQNSASTDSAAAATRYWYGVKRGRKPGVYLDWEAVTEQVIGFKDAAYRKFDNENEAYGYMGTTKREYFEALEQDAATAGAEFTQEREQAKLVKRAKQRIVLEQWREAQNAVDEEAAKMSNPADVNRVDFLLEYIGNLLGIQAEFNKYRKLDLMRKNTMTDIMHELSDLSEEQTQDFLDSCPSADIRKTFEVLKDDTNIRDFKEHVKIRQEQKLAPQTFHQKWGKMHERLNNQVAYLATNYEQGYEDRDARVVYTDGANLIGYRHEDDNSKAGWGVWFGLSDPLNAYGRVPGEQDSDRAEILALVMAIRIISRQPEYKNDLWELRTDSSWTAQMVSTGWTGLSASEGIRTHHNFHLLQRLRTLLYENQNIVIRTVRSHSYDLGNDKADRLAKMGASCEYQDTVKKYGRADEGVFIHDPVMVRKYPRVEYKWNKYL